MSTDFEDPQLDDLLAGYARTWNAGFTTPPLAGMLEQATSGPDRRRWLLSAVAAVLLLAVPVTTVLVLHRDRSTSTPAGKVTERSLGTTPWSSAVLLADGAVAVHVSTKVPCGQPIPFVRAAVISTTPTTITITASRYLRSDASLAPPAPGSSSCANSPDVIFGDQPTVKVPDLAGKHLIDGSTGQQNQFLDARSVASPTYLPRGFVDDGLSWSEESSTHQLNVQHDYHNAKGTLTIDRLTFSDPVDEPFGGTAVGPIHGHTGQWMASLGQLSWVSGNYVWTVQEIAYNGTGKTQLDLKTMLRIANSLP